MIRNVIRVIANVGQPQLRRRPREWRPLHHAVGRVAQEKRFGVGNELALAHSLFGQRSVDQQGETPAVAVHGHQCPGGQRDYGLVCDQSQAVEIGVGFDLQRLFFLWQRV